MPKGKGTYGSKRGRPAKKGKGKKKSMGGLSAAQKKLPPALQKALMKKKGKKKAIALLHQPSFRLKLLEEMQLPNHIFTSQITFCETSYQKHVHQFRAMLPHLKHFELLHQ